MPSTRELRRRIRSVKNTAQITKAMQMVAATKMRCAQTQALAGRPYLQAVAHALYELLGKVKKESHSLFVAKDSAKTGILLLSTDKSLCGALNANLLRFTMNFIQDKEAVFYSIGKKGRNFVVKTGNTLTGDFENKDLIEFSAAATIARMLTGAFLAQELKEVYVVYPHFVSTLNQEPKALKIAPVSEFDIKEGMHEEASSDVEILLEPDADSLFEYVLTHFIETSVYQAMLETKASEHSARMIAMQNATDNAKELVSDLQLAYNQTRQAAITNELLEITSALAALE